MTSLRPVSAAADIIAACTALRSVYVGNAAARTSGVDIYGACGGPTRCETVNDTADSWASGTSMAGECAIRSNPNGVTDDDDELRTPLHNHK